MKMAVFFLNPPESIRNFLPLNTTIQLIRTNVFQSFYFGIINQAKTNHPSRLRSGRDKGVCDTWDSYEHPTNLPEHNENDQSNGSA